MKHWTRYTMMAAAMAVAFGTLAPAARADDEKKYTEIADRVMKQMDNMVTAIESVQDEASAKAAAEKLNKVADEFNKLATEIEGIGEPSEQTQQAIQKRFEKKEAELEKRMEAWQASLVDTDQATQQAIMEHVFPPLMKIGAAAQKLEALGGDDAGDEADDADMEDEGMDDEGMDDEGMDDEGMDDAEEDAEEEAPAM